MDDGRLRLSGSSSGRPYDPLAVAAYPPVERPALAASARLAALPRERLWLAAWGAALAAFLISRVVVVLSAWAGVQQLVQVDPARDKGLLVEGALLWDSTWYWHVVNQGYYFSSPEHGSNLAFCPLYPLVLRGLTGALDVLNIHVGDPVYGNFVLAGLLTSNLCFLLALVVLWRLVREHHPASVADRTLLLVGVFPTGLFWSAIYTESLFFLLVVSVFWLARREHWLLAAALAGLAGITRWAGILLAVVIVLEFLYRPGVPARTWAARLRAARDPNLLWLALIPLPLLGFLAYMNNVFGDPLIFFAAEERGWGHGLAFFPQVWLDGLNMLIASWQSLAPALDPVLHWGGGQRFYLYQDLAYTAFFAGLAGWAAWRRLLRPADLAWLVLGLIFPLSLGTTMSLARYLLPLWPAFLVIARLLEGRPRLERGWLIASTGLLAVTTYLWASAHWVG
jgi:hypothetical protein